MRTTRKNTRGDVLEASGSFHTFSKSGHETWTRIGSAGPESGPSGILRVNTSSVPKQITLWAMKECPFFGANIGRTPE